MQGIGTATHRPIAFVLGLGLLGGGALITTVWATTRGPMVLLPYAALVVVTAAYLRIERVQPFVRRFNLALSAFMMATVILYFFIGLVDAKTLLIILLLGHAWRLGLMLLIGIVVSATVAQLTATKAARPAD